MSKVTNTTIARAVLADIARGASMQDVTKSLAAFLIEERRVADASAIVRDIERQLLVSKGELYVRATSATPLASDMLEQIKTMFNTSGDVKKVVIEETIDKTVIGGVRCETAEKRLDLTVHRQLQRLKRQES
ncbi:MAG: F0F1 ATP synthase subunit delta [Candidatus Saccharibacteria bacterium]